MQLDSVAQRFLVCEAKRRGGTQGGGGSTGATGGRWAWRRTRPLWLPGGTFLFVGHSSR
jgi:hypothetical protein